MAKHFERNRPPPPMLGRSRSNGLRTKGGRYSTHLREVNATVAERTLRSQITSSPLLALQPMMRLSRKPNKTQTNYLTNDHCGRRLWQVNPLLRPAFAEQGAVCLASPQLEHDREQTAAVPYLSVSSSHPRDPTRTPGKPPLPQDLGLL